MDSQPVAYAGLPYLGLVVRAKLMDRIWLDDQMIARLLTEQGMSQQGEGMFIEMGIVAIMEGLQTICTEQPKLKLELQVCYDIEPNPDIVYSPTSNPLPVISLMMLDTILNSPERFMLIRTVRGTRQDLDKDTIRLLQRFTIGALQLLANTPG